MKPALMICPKCKDTKARLIQIETTIKQAMKDLPPGEHLHVASIVFGQNSEIVCLKRIIKNQNKKEKR